MLVAGCVGSLLTGAYIAENHSTGNVVIDTTIGLTFGGVGIASLFGAAIEQNRAETEDKQRAALNRGGLEPTGDPTTDSINACTITILEAGGSLPIQYPDGKIWNMTAVDLQPKQ